MLPRTVLVVVALAQLRLRDKSSRLAMSKQASHFVHETGALRTLTKESRSLAVEVHSIVKCDVCGLNSCVAAPDLRRRLQTASTFVACDDDL